MQHFSQAEKGSSNHFMPEAIPDSWGKVGIVVINSQEGRTSSLPKVSEAMDYQLQHEIS